MLRERFRLYLITDDTGRPLRELIAIVEAALQGGVTAVQLREKHASVTDLSRMVESIAPICKRYGALFLLNAALWHPSLPLDQVDGLHLQASTWFPSSPKGALARWLAERPQAVVVYSAHSLEEMSRVFATGVRAMTISPIYLTPSKDGILSPLGPAAINVARRELPNATIIALGGIACENVAEVIAAGADGIAVIRAIFADSNPEVAARRLRHEVDLALTTAGWVPE
ncbi:MAG: thiamine phosphate synthase [Candidatus Sumerlaeaceae bacterium]|nr:thiamine phosphate synthase [Candidatus Sumerlaeaceae bacterium]